MKALHRIFLLTIIFILSSNLNGQELGSIFIGVNNYFVSNENNEFNVNSTGLSIGWLIPINYSSLKIFYKVKASHHNINNYYSYKYQKNLEYFFSAINEILIGKEIQLNGNISIIPQFGIGAIGEAAYYDWDKGFTHGEVFIDISLILKYNLKIIDVGLMFNFEKDIIPSSSSLISDKRMNVSLLIIR